MSDDDMATGTPRSSDSDTSDDDSVKQPIESLVAGRERRKTAGNRYDREMVLEEAPAEDEPDEVTLLFADNEEEEDEEFKSDEPEDDGDMSSSDDDDQGPNAATADDQEGEHELQKQAKDERSKKRKADLALTSVAGLRKKLKTDPTRPSLPSAKLKPSKKKERVTWVHAPDSGRSSLRKQTIAHRAETIQRLKESEAQSKKMKALKEKRDREKADDAPKELTQADRLAEAARVERQNAKSLNRWEAMEKKRQEEQAAKLAALKNRKLQGPVVSFWSAKAKWIGARLNKIGTKEGGDLLEGGGGGGPPKKKPGRKTKAELERLAAEKNAELTNSETVRTGTENTTPDNPAGLPPPVIGQLSTEKPPPVLLPPEIIPQTPATSDSVTKPTAPEMTLPVPEADLPVSNPSLPIQDKRMDVEEPKTEAAPVPPPVDLSKEQDAFLEGIHEYATMQEGANTPSSGHETPQQPADVPKPGPESAEQMPDVEMPLAGIEKEEDLQLPSGSTADKQKPLVGIGKEEVELQQPSDPNPDVQAPRAAVEIAEVELQQPSNPTPDVTSSTVPLNISTSNPGLSSQVPAPVLEAKADSPERRISQTDQHMMVMGPLVRELPNNDNIKTEMSESQGLHDVKLADPLPEPVVEYSTRNLLILEKFDELSNQARQEYALFFNQRKQGRATAKSLKHSQELCPITAFPVRYRDPDTGIAYASAAAYKKLQELKNHQYAWSSILGCYVGRSGGTAARGVPEGFIEQ